MDAQLPAARLLNAFTQHPHWPSFEQLYGANMLTLFMLYYACGEAQANYYGQPTFVPPQTKLPDSLRDALRLPRDLAPLRRRFRPFYSIGRLMSSPAITVPPRERFDSMCRKLGVAVEYGGESARRVAEAYYIYKYFYTPRQPARRSQDRLLTEGILLENSLAWAEILRGLQPPESPGSQASSESSSRSDESGLPENSVSSNCQAQNVLLALLTHTLPAHPPAESSSVEMNFALHIQAKGSAFYPQSKIKRLTDMLVHGKECEFFAERMPSIDVYPHAMHKFKDCKVAGIRLCCQKMLDPSTTVLAHALSPYDKAWLYYCDAICPAEDSMQRE